MKIRLTLFVLSFLIISIAQGQSVDYSLSNEIKVWTLEFPTDLISTKGNGKIIHTGAPMINKIKSYWVDFSNPDSPTREKFGTPFDKSYAKNFVNLGDRIFWSLSVKDKKSKQLYDMLVEYDEHGKVLEIMKIDSSDYSKYGELPTQLIRYSPDSSKVLLLNIVDEDHNSDPYLIRAIVIDSNAKQVSKYSFLDESKKSQKMIDLTDCQVANDGSFTIVEKKYFDKPDESRKIGKKKVANYHLSVIDVDKDGKVSVDDLESTGGFFDACRIFNFKNGTVMLAYAKRGKREDSSVKGFDFFVKKPGDTEYTVVEHLFSQAEIDRFGKWDKRDLGFVGHAIVQAQYQEKGDDKILFLLEKSNYISKRQGDMLMQYHVLGSSLIVEIDSDARITETTLVPKYNENQFLQPQSLIINYKGKPALLYSDLNTNEDREIKDYKKFHKVKMFRSAYVSEVIAYKSDSGELIREYFEDIKKLFIYRQFAYTNDKGEVVVPATKKANLVKRNLLFITIENSKMN